ncbi:hypothetical protein DYB32_000488 [Aphanomyces invadans]|uniref:3'-5' exonuclease domain-containing protein n=1 Tax=Aphanomyces invadans TaxID=157072 RepID=A0A3R6VTX1_9STRA|nr:hypothetical protein DYB32_000488 [Aphanomyces invadans]
MIQNMSLVPHLPSEIVMRHLLRRKDVECADRFVWNDPVRQRDLVRLMIDMRIDDKLIKKRLTKFKIPPTDFPDFVERRRRATLRFLVHAQQYGDIPDAAGASPAARIYAANLLYEQCGFDNPVTRHIVHLFGLGRRFPDVVALAASSFDLGANKDDPPPLPGFLTLETFHATVEFVDTVKAATTAAAYLSNELYVGLDTEWRSSFDASEAATTPCAVLQLASSTRIFVIDLLSRQNGPAILAAFKPLLASDKVLKVGLDVSGDFRALGVRPAHQILDLQTVHKALHGHEAPLTGAKTSLNDLSIAYLGLPLDKRPRMSNWARRPLTTSQLNYAALDALAPLCIYFAMKQAADQSTSHKSAKTSHRGAPHNLFGARWTYSIS